LHRLLRAGCYHRVAKVSPGSDSALVTLDDLIGELPEVTTTTGTVKVRDMDIAYWKFEEEGTRKPPVIGLHGGPAFTHNYILPLKLLAASGYPVILYDQAGCGMSTNGVNNPAESAPHLLTIEYYVEELKELVSQLKLVEHYVFGSSWGSVLAQEYAVTLPKGLLGLVLDGALSDGQTYIKTQWRDRISQLPSFTQKLLRKLEDEKA
jgi:proline-specific peptidase